MPNMNYTKGEWKYLKDDSVFNGHSFRERHIIKGHKMIAEMRMPDGEELDSNAHLISAAPDMCEALKEARIVLKNQGQYCMNTQTKINKALVKAEGKDA